MKNLISADLLERELGYYRWQRVRRNPRYISSYAKYQQDEISKKEIQEIMKEYGFDTAFLREPLNPHDDAQEDQEIHCYDKVWQLDPPEDKLIPTTTKAPLKNKDNRIFENLFEPAVEIITPFPEDDKYITLKIDYTKRPRLVRDKIDQVLSFLWQTEGKDTTRNRFKEMDNQFRVWDLRYERRPFKEIAMALYPDVNLEKAENRAKQQFMAAWERIMGEEYDRERYKEFFKDKDLLPKTCNDCPDHPDRGGTCNTPCPRMAAYIDSDYVSQRELTYTEAGLDWISQHTDGTGLTPKRPGADDYDCD